MGTTSPPRWMPQRRFGGFMPTQPTDITLTSTVEALSTVITQMEVDIPISRGFPDDDDNNMHLMGLKLILTGVGGFLIFLFLIFLILFLLGKKMDCSCNCCSCPTNNIPIPSIDLDILNKCRANGRGRLVKTKEMGKQDHVAVGVDLISL